MALASDVAAVAEAEAGAAREKQARGFDPASPSTHAQARAHVQVQGRQAAMVRVPRSVVSPLRLVLVEKLCFEEET